MKIKSEMKRSMSRKIKRMKRKTNNDKKEWKRLKEETEKRDVYNNL